MNDLKSQGTRPDPLRGVGRWQIGLAALVLAHLITLKSWALLLVPSPRHFYWLTAPPAQVYLSLAALILLLTAILLSVHGAAAVPQRGRMLLWLAFIVLGLGATGRVLAAGIPPFLFRGLAHSKVWLVLGFLAASGALIYRLGAVRTEHAVHRFLLILSPLLPILWGQAYLERASRYLPFRPVTSD